MEVDYYYDNIGYDCIFKGLALGNCSNDKRMLFICDFHLSRILNIDTKSSTIITSENRYPETIKYTSLNLRSRNKVFPILYDFRDDRLCFRNNATTLLNEYIATLDIPRNKSEQITQILSHAISGLMLYGRGVICENTSTIHRFLNDERLKQSLDKYWTDASITAIVNNPAFAGDATAPRTRVVDLDVKALPIFYRMFLSLFIISSLANTVERKSVTPNLVFNISEGYIMLTRDVLLSNNETDFSSPLIILGKRNVDGDLSLHPILKNAQVTLYNFEPFKYAPCEPNFQSQAQP